MLLLLLAWRIFAAPDTNKTPEGAAPAGRQQASASDGRAQKPAGTAATNSDKKTDDPTNATAPASKTATPSQPGGNAGTPSGSATTPDSDPPPQDNPTSATSYPNASNTGPSGCSSYTNHAGSLTVTTNGTVLSCINLTGTLYINADNVTVQNSILTGTSWWGIRYGNTKTDATGFKLLHSKLQTVPGQGPDNGGYDYGIAQEASGSMEIAYNDISGYKDGITASSNAYIHHNYIHDLSEFTGSHSQGIYVYTGPGQVKIEHNTIINGAPQSQATAAIYIAPDDGHQNDRIITDNILGGGAYVIYGGDSTATNIVVTNNKFTTQVTGNGGYFGVRAYWQAGNTGNVWSGNTWDDGPNKGNTAP